MKAHEASLINALLLIALSIWGFLAADKYSPTAFIPAGFGLALLACYPGVKAENKIIAHIAVLLTLIILIALFTPLRSALEEGDGMAILRVGTMLASTAIAVVFFIKSFIDARKQRDMRSAAGKD